jgi:3-oxoadipate enol-lactonase
VPEAIVGVIRHVDVNGARLLVDEAGDGPAVVLLHGGLGDMRLWEPVARRLAKRFRVVRYDFRHFGGSTGPGVAFSNVDDLVGLLDELELGRAALVGLSKGGRIALDAALAHPERIWALAHVAGAVSGADVDPYEPEDEAVFESGDLDASFAIDMRVWAPLGADEAMRAMWDVTPDARGVPEGADQIQPSDARPEELAMPTLVVTARHDPPAFREAGEEVARRAGARLVEVDSDHYLTVREPEQVGELLLEFLTAAATA